MTNVSNEKVEKTSSSRGSSFFAPLVIVACLIVGFLIYNFVMGNPANFENNDPVNGHPLPGSILGTVYKGGIVVAVLMSLFLMTFVFGLERFFVISKAAGKGNVDKFVEEVKVLILAGKIEEAKTACDAQQGSVANVVKAALVKFSEVKKDGLDNEKAAEMIQKEIDAATSLEMPMLEQNMVILSTLVSIGTLIGLLGTVSGMIKAFAGLAAAGAPDQAALANGISEALINTATGIGTSTLAIIFYNFFTSKIDKLTYSIDETAFALAQAYRRLK
ncbi:MAG: MotA/TolQ/ExbB proton channel family protein [Flavobacterium sp.]|nr:MotA/TolQ/ExbB proton channel family protein [Candidatus Neoflavobacterium equi]